MATFKMSINELAATETFVSICTLCLHEDICTFSMAKWITKERETQITMDKLFVCLFSWLNVFSRNLFSPHFIWHFIYTPFTTSSVSKFYFEVWICLNLFISFDHLTSILTPSSKMTLFVILFLSGCITCTLMSPTLTSSGLKESLETFCSKSHNSQVISPFITLLADCHGKIAVSAFASLPNSTQDIWRGRQISPYTFSCVRCCFI